MNTLEAIRERRSIRKFTSAPITDDQIRTILEAAIQAPSGKNRQPWKFIVVKDDKRADMVRVMRAGIEKMKAQGEETGSAEWTARIMEHTPVTVFIFNPDGVHPWMLRSIGQMFQEVVDVQSIGAAFAMYRGRPRPVCERGRSRYA